MFARPRIYTHTHNHVYTMRRETAEEMSKEDWADCRECVVKRETGFLTFISRFDGLLVYASEGEISTDRNYISLLVDRTNHDISNDDNKKRNQAFVDW